MDEFDLLAGIGRSEDDLLRRGDGKEAGKVLLWKKLETNGHVPSAREVLFCYKRQNDSACKHLLLLGAFCCCKRDQYFRLRWN